MKTTRLETSSLTLVLQSPERARAMVDALSPSARREVSPEWLARITAATLADPWLHGFEMVHRASGTVVGTAAFKAPPDPAGVVEVAYAVAPEHENRGYATEAADALAAFAFATGEVRIVWAHTRAEPNASTRVLTKCGFQCVGEVTDPEDGLVWRWEKRPPAVDR